MKTVQEHKADGTYQPCRHEERAKNSERFNYLEKLPAPKNKKLNTAGKAFYKKFGADAVSQGILTALDLPLLELAAYKYQEVEGCREQMGGDVPEFLHVHKITVQNALVSYYKSSQLELIEILKVLGASPATREKISVKIKDKDPAKLSILDTVKK